MIESVVLHAAVEAGDTLISSVLNILERHNFISSNTQADIQDAQAALRAGVYVATLIFAKGTGTENVNIGANNGGSVKRDGSVGNAAMTLSHWNITHSTTDYSWHNMHRNRTLLPQILRSQLVESGVRTVSTGVMQYNGMTLAMLKYHTSDNTSHWHVRP